MKRRIPFLFLALSLAAAARAGGERVSLDEPGGEHYLIEGRFQVEAALPQVWAVLTDYGSLKGVVSSLVESTVVERTGNMALVDQVARGGLFFVKRSVKLRLQICEEPQKELRFEDTLGEIFRIYRGSWKIEQGGGQGGPVEVRYTLEVSRAALAPAFIERKLFKSNALVLLRELRSEILRRAASQAYLPPRIK